MDITGMSLTLFPLVMTERNTAKYYNASKQSYSINLLLYSGDKITLISGLDKTCGDCQSKTHTKILGTSTRYLNIFCFSAN